MSHDTRCKCGHLDKEHMELGCAPYIIDVHERCPCLKFRAVEQPSTPPVQLYEADFVLEKVLDFLDAETPEDAEPSHWAAMAYQAIGTKFLLDKPNTAQAAPTCPYCGMNMKLGDGYWWCMNKTCHKQLYPYGIAQPALTPHDIAIRRNEAPDYSAEPVQTGEAKPAPWMKKVVSAWFGSALKNDNREKELLALLITYAPQTAPSSSASEYESAGEFFNRVYKAPCVLPFVPTMSTLEFAERYAEERRAK